VVANGDVLIDEFSWARTQTRGGPGDTPTAHEILGSLTNHGLFSLGTAGDDLGTSPNAGSDLVVRGGLVSDARLEIHGRTLTIDGGPAGALSGNVLLAGGTLRTTSGATLASSGVQVNGNGLFDVAFASGAAVRLEGLINYQLVGATQSLAAAGGPVTWSGAIPAGGGMNLSGGLAARVGANGIANGGQISLQDAGTALALPAAPETADWREFALTGTGTLAFATGTSLELFAGISGGADQHARIENAVTVAAGATLRAFRPVEDPAVGPGTNLLSGGLVNHGTLLLGEAAHAGSHLTVSGGFQSDGSVTAREAILTVHEVPGATLGGTLAFTDGGLRGTGSTVFATTGLTLTGSGSMDAAFANSGTVNRENFVQTGGTLRISGGELVWSGSIAAGATLALENGANAASPAPLTVTNDGLLTASGGGTIRFSAGPTWEERQLLGSGRIEIGNDSLLQLDPFSYSNPFGTTGAGPVSLENSVVIGTGGRLLVTQGSTESYYHPGQATIKGDLANAGTIDLGTETISGSHLAVLGRFENSGVINLRGRMLSLDGSALGTVGGQINLGGGTLVSNGANAVDADDLTVQGSGNLGLALTSGKVSFLGADTELSYNGVLPASATFCVGDGARLNAGLGFGNFGEVEVGAGAVFRTPWDWNAWSDEKVLGGGGAIRIGNGGRMEMRAAEWHYFGSNAYQWLALENNLTVEAGGELLNLQGAGWEHYMSCGTNVIRGALANAGTIRLGTETQSGSHLRVIGPFSNTGLIELHGRSLSMNPPTPAGLAQFGGEIRLFGASIGDEAVPVSVAHPVIRGTGTVGLLLTGGEMTLDGAGTQLSLRGGVGAGVKVTVQGGADVQLGLMPTADPIEWDFVNDGQIIVTGSGSILRGPPHAYRYRNIKGNGTIRLENGSRMEVDSNSFWNWIWENRYWTRVYNTIDIQPGGELRTWSREHAAYWAEFYGPVSNSGTLRVQVATSMAQPFENRGLVHLETNSLYVTGKMINRGVLLCDQGFVYPSGGLEQMPEGEIHFMAANPFTIAKTGGGKVLSHPNQALTFEAGSTLDGWEVSGLEGTTARIPTAQTGAECTLTGQWRPVPSPFGDSLDLRGPDGRVMVLEMSYADTGMGAFENSLFLGWRNPAGTFVHASEGNGGQGDFAVANFDGSWEALAAGGRTLAELLGSYGIDRTRNRVWAVINRTAAPAGENYAVTATGWHPAYQAWLADVGLDGTPGRESGPGDDPDGDGRTNREEFAFDGDPLQPGADGKVKGGVVLVVGGEWMFALTLPVRDGAVFHGPGDLAAPVDGIVYVIQGSADLLDFSSLDIGEVTGPEALAAQAGLPALSPGWSYRTFRLPGPVGPPRDRAFMRAGVE
jgi:hypothetical protein